jgi:hypothetical protein
MTMRSMSVLLLALVCSAAQASAQLELPPAPRLSQIPQRLPDPPREKLATTRAGLVEQNRALIAAVRTYNTGCANKPASTGCSDQKEGALTKAREYVAAATAFNADLTDAMVAGLARFLRENSDYRVPDQGAPRRGDGPSVTRSRDAVFVGGTGWVYGYVRRNSDKLEQAARADFKAAQKLAGIADGDFMSVDNYDMVMGIAADQDFGGDLIDRVVGLPLHRSDQNSLGDYSAEGRALYASLRGTRTARLDCHSNGAMICLHALTYGDITAADASGTKRLAVRLFGPQISPRALEAWRDLLAGGTITSLEINMNVGDPVAPASLAVAESPWATAALRLAKALVPSGRPVGKLDLSQFDFFSAKAAEDARAEIQRGIPNARVNVRRDAECLRQVSALTDRPNANAISACHDMRVYQRTSP